MALAAGIRLGPYEIRAPLGAGGMGELYRARDTQLKRDVALKVLPEAFARDPERMARFQREAEVLALLNQPNIAAIYGVAEGGGVRALVMELVEGQTLDARLDRAKLSIADTLRYGAQIAEALAEAHARGIVHRDLKPGNIMLSRSGVKVLDFGLAKLTTADETLTSSRVLMGTPAYMAPEQREGSPTDSRTDIYALGLVLYEMAVGKRAVHGQTGSLENMPAQLAHVIERCLAPDPDDRWQSARDVKAELQWARPRRPRQPYLCEGAYPGPGWPLQ